MGKIISSLDLCGVNKSQIEKVRLSQEHPLIMYVVLSDLSLEKCFVPMKSFLDATELTHRKLFRMWHQVRLGTISCCRKVIFQTRNSACFMVLAAERLTYRYQGAWIPTTAQIWGLYRGLAKKINNTNVLDEKMVNSLHCHFSPAMKKMQNCGWGWIRKCFPGRLDWGLFCQTELYY